MRTSREPRPYTNPYVAGTLLGVVLFLSLYVTAVSYTHLTLPTIFRV